MAHWSVTVERDGEKIVTIESNCLSGREISTEDEDTIRTAANHLLSFIGVPWNATFSPYDVCPSGQNQPMGS